VRVQAPYSYHGKQAHQGHSSPAVESLASQTEGRAPQEEGGDDSSPQEENSHGGPKGKEA
jgi:hypothetical protein